MSLGKTLKRVHFLFHFKSRNNEHFEDDTSALLFRAIQHDG